MNYQIHFLDKQADFNQAMKSVAQSTWIGFDTEFVGEKTYIPILCLIQVVTEKDIYLIDTLSIADLNPFLTMLSDPKILKITHAGDNDYRLLNTLYETVPQNTFDTQIAAGFVGYNYPAGFGKIVERELRITLAKSHTVANWEDRPLDPKALEYAIEDVKYLPALHKKLTDQLRAMQREEWAREENRKWETVDCYYVDPYKEVLANDYIYQLDFKRKVFLLRIFSWRREKAATLNIPKEAVLQSRHINTVLRAIKDGHQAFRANRTMPEGIWRKYLPEWKQLWETKPIQAEIDWLHALPAPAPDDPDQAWSMELVYHFVKHQCLQHEISAALLLPKGEFNKLKSGGDFDTSLLSGWRAQLLGKNLVNWLLKKSTINVDWQDNGCLLTMD